MASFTFTFTKPQSQVMVLLATMVVAMLKDCNAWEIIPPKVTVQISNNITPHQDLKLHCKSKNDDKGEHTIRFGETYEFRFRPAPVLDITLYFCSFWWPAEPRLHHLDIYDEQRDKWCTTCSWKVWQYGACIYNRFSHYNQCLPWKENKPQSLADATSITSNTTHY